MATPVTYSSNEDYDNSTTRETCECHLINWQALTYKCDGSQVIQHTAPDCQSKNNNGFWSNDEYYYRCIHLPQMFGNHLCLADGRTKVNIVGGRWTGHQGYVVQRHHRPNYPQYTYIKLIPIGDVTEDEKDIAPTVSCEDNEYELTL